MTGNYLKQILALHDLTEIQQEAVTTRGADLIVTAGAGTGKTRTLVTRYLGLLAEGNSVQETVAITFTEKAAREMRNRVRKDMQEIISMMELDTGRQFWNHLIEQVDSARISTIHSLCTEILRAHPAEANIDPEFKVLEEGHATLMKKAAVETVLARMLLNSKSSTVFEFLDLRDLRGILEILLEQRAELESASVEIDRVDVLLAYIRNTLEGDCIGENIALIGDLHNSGKLGEDAQNLAPQLVELLGAWAEIEASLNKGDLVAVGQGLFSARRKIGRAHV